MVRRWHIEEDEGHLRFLLSSSSLRSSRWENTDTPERMPFKLPGFEILMNPSITLNLKANDAILSLICHQMYVKGSAAPQASSEYWFFNNFCLQLILRSMLMVFVQDTYHKGWRNRFKILVSYLFISISNNYIALTELTADIWGHIVGVTALTSGETGQKHEQTNSEQRKRRWTVKY